MPGAENGNVDRVNWKGTVSECLKKVTSPDSSVTKSSRRLPSTSATSNPKKPKASGRSATSTRNRYVAAFRCPQSSVIFASSSSKAAHLRKFAAMTASIGVSQAMERPRFLYWLDVQHCALNTQSSQ